MENRTKTSNTDCVPETAGLGDKRIEEIVLEELSACVLGISCKEISDLADALVKEKRIFCDGVGRSLLQVKAFAMRLTQMGFQSVVVGETTTPAITERDILLICSGSGETPMLVEHAARAKAAGATVLLMTATKGASLEKISDSSILIEASSKASVSIFSVQPMGSLFEQSVGILCDSMVLRIMKKYHISSEEMYQNHSNLE